MRNSAIFVFCLASLSTVQAQLLVSDRATNRVLTFDHSTGEFLNILVDGDPAANGGLIAPSAMAIGHDGELLVASQFTGQVLRYDFESGDFLGEFAAQINGPSGLLYDEARDRVYVSTLGNFDSELVMHYQASTGKLVGSFGEGTGPSGRTALSFGPDQQLYVGSFANDEFFSGSVLRFDAETLDALGTFAAGPGLAGANGMVFSDASEEDSASYRLDVVGLFSSTVVRFDAATDESGNLVTTGSDVLIGEGLDFPAEVLDLADGTLLVSNLGNDNPATGDLRPGSVGRYNADSGDFIEVFLEAGGPGELSQPTDMLLVGNSPDLDCNGDGVIDQSDVDCACSAGLPLNDVLSAIGSLPGDADFDGQVQFSDFAILAENFGAEGVYSQGDFDCDADIQFSDFVVLADNFGRAVANSAVGLAITGDRVGGNVAAVPEPGTIAMIPWLVWLLCLHRLPGQRCRD